MIKCSEYVSPGHPDKIADYISQYLLDRYIEIDHETRYAVEVQIKDNTVTLGGEVSSDAMFTESEIASHVRKAVEDIGYTDAYLADWGPENTICGSLLTVNSHIGQQSSDIAQGCNNDGWGDQGIFFGYCEYRPDTCGMPYEHSVAKRLCKDLFDSGLGGIDIKTQVVTRNGSVNKVIVAIPLHPDGRTTIRNIRHFVRKRIPGRYKLIVNGTGNYVKHSSIADCGTTGRKLAVDFYGGGVPVGGGCPWTKDASKADLTLNLCARKMAIGYAIRYKVGVQVSLACCIGKKAVDCCISDLAGNTLFEHTIDISPKELRKAYHLDKPIYSSMCKFGLFGEFQRDKAWEIQPTL